jgi:hypothetical protein
MNFFHVEKKFWSFQGRGRNEEVDSAISICTEGRGERRIGETPSALWMMTNQIKKYPNSTGEIEMEVGRGKKVCICEGKGRRRRSHPSNRQMHNYLFTIFYIFICCLFGLGGGIFLNSPLVHHTNMAEIAKHLVVIHSIANNKSEIKMGRRGVGMCSLFATCWEY